MKSYARFLAVAIILSSTINSSAQTCMDPSMTLSYDTTVIGSGNGLHSFTFPKYNPGSGTLMSVRLETEITLRYSYELENRENITINNYRVRVTREDEISSSVLPDPFTNLFVRTYGPFSLTSWDGTVGTGTDYVANGPMYVMNHTKATQTVYNTADYLGNGTVNFDYLSTTYSSVLGSVNYTFNATAQDTIKFRLIYTYCPTFFLKSDISSFNAIKSDEKNIDLHWITQNEKKDRVYEIQISNDGRNFERVDRRIAEPDATSTGTYRYTYSYEPANAGSKLIFRLKQIEKDGTVKYSAIRIIDNKKAQHSSLRIYPSPARQQTQLIFDNKKRSNYKVELFNMNGMLVKTFEANNALTARLSGLEQFTPGMYFIKATNRNTHEVLTNRLLIQ
ncbi:MAG: T9SS type A sorting domain-containing protein [Chitinophagaceae bacterium]|nr:T9SS type A sorting domain-containing protein [Chitinophagaceae bacterium]